MGPVVRCCVQATTSQCRAHVAAIIIWLYGQDAKNAYLCYQARRSGAAAFVLMWPVTLPTQSD